MFGWRSLRELRLDEDIRYMGVRLGWLERDLYNLLDFLDVERASPVGTPVFQYRKLKGREKKDG